MKTIATLGSRGGSGKSTMNRLLALGAAKCGFQAMCLVTDITRSAQPDDENRPFLIIDGTQSVDQLAATYNAYLDAYKDNKRAVMVIDGCASRPEIDTWISQVADFTIISLTPDMESVRAAQRSWDGIEGPKGIAISRWRNDARWQQDRARYIELLPVRPFMTVPEQSALVHLLDDAWRQDVAVNRAARMAFLHVAPHAGILSKEKAKELLAA